METFRDLYDTYKDTLNLSNDVLHTNYSLNTLDLLEISGLYNFYLKFVKMRIIDFQEGIHLVKLLNLVFYVFKGRLEAS